MIAPPDEQPRTAKAAWDLAAIGIFGLAFAFLNTFLAWRQIWGLRSPWADFGVLYSGAWNIARGASFPVGRNQIVLSLWFLAWLTRLFGLTESGLIKAMLFCQEAAIVLNAGLLYLIAREILKDRSELESRLAGLGLAFCGLLFPFYHHISSPQYHENDVFSWFALLAVYFMLRDRFLPFCLAYLALPMVRSNLILQMACLALILAKERRWKYLAPCLLGLWTAWYGTGRFYMVLQPAAVRAQCAPHLAAADTASLSKLFLASWGASLPEIARNILTHPVFLFSALWRDGRNLLGVFLTLFPWLPAALLDFRAAVLLLPNIPYLLSAHGATADLTQGWHYWYETSLFDMVSAALALRRITASLDERGLNWETRAWRLRLSLAWESNRAPERSRKLQKALVLGCGAWIFVGTLWIYRTYGESWGTPRFSWARYALGPREEEGHRLLDRLAQAGGNSANTLTGRTATGLLLKNPVSLPFYEELSPWYLGQMGLQAKDLYPFYPVPGKEFIFFNARETKWSNHLADPLELLLLQDPNFGVIDYAPSGFLLLKKGAPRTRNLEALRELYYRHVFEAENMLPANFATHALIVRDPGASNARAVKIPARFFRKRSDENELYGPFKELMDGSYTAVYWIKVAAEAGTPVAVATLNIHSLAGGVLAERSLSGYDFPAAGRYVPIELPFTITPANRGFLEFRLASSGLADIYVDRVEVRPFYPFKEWLAKISDIRSLLQPYAFPGVLSLDKPSGTFPVFAMGTFYFAFFADCSRVNCDSEEGIRLGLQWHGSLLDRKEERRYRFSEMAWPRNAADLYRLVTEKWPGIVQPEGTQVSYELSPLTSGPMSGQLLVLAFSWSQ